MMSDTKLGFIGLGNMGNPMAARLLEAGHSLIVYDLDTKSIDALVKQGAESAASVSDIAERADIVFLSLPTPDVVKAVTLGAEGLSKGSKVSVIVDLSTTGPQVAGEVGEGLKACGKTLIDCPISGGITGAVNGTLAVMASGDVSVLEELAPVLSVFGKFFNVGDTPGQAQTLKVINNLMSTAALAITSEAMVLGVKAGLDPDLMLEVINAGSGRNTSSTDKIPNYVLNRNFDFGMPIGLSAKDARLCLEVSDRLGVPMIVGTAVRQLLNITRDQFGPDVDMTNVIRTIEQWAHTEVRGKAAR